METERTYVFHFRMICAIQHDPPLDEHLWFMPGKPYRSITLNIAKRCFFWLYRERRISSVQQSITRPANFGRCQRFPLARLQ